MSNAIEQKIEELKVSDETAITLRKSFGDFLIQAEQWAEKAKSLVVTDISQKEEMKQAREARLAIRNLRLDADKKRKELKEDSLKYAKAVQEVYNKIEDALSPIEEHLMNQEKFEERYKEAQIVIKRARRTEESKHLSEFIPSSIDLGVISADEYILLITGAQLQLDNKLEAERAAEEARIEKERVAELKNKYKEILLPYSLWITDYSSIVLEDLTDESCNAIIESAKALKKKQEEENDRIRLEKIEADKKAEQERKEKEQAQMKLKQAEDEKRKQDERAKLLQPYIIFIRDYNKLISSSDEDFKKEFKDIKRGAEDHWEFEREEKRNQEEEEKKLAMAPDKDKLILLSSQILFIQLPELSSTEAIAIRESVKNLLIKISSFIDEKVEKL